MHYDDISTFFLKKRNHVFNAVFCFYTFTVSSPLIYKLQKLDCYNSRMAVHVWCRHTSPTSFFRCDTKKVKINSSRESCLWYAISIIRLLYNFCSIIVTPILILRAYSSADSNKPHTSYRSLKYCTNGKIHRLLIFMKWNWNILFGIIRYIIQGEWWKLLN